MRHDLVAELATAEVTTEPREIELVSPGPNLVDGWSDAENDAREGRPFVWGLGEASVLRFPVLQPRDLELVFECRALRFEGAPPQRVRFVLNGEDLGEIRLRYRRREYRLLLPASGLHAGWNTLRIVYAYHRRRSEVIPRASDDRSVAASWYRLAFESDDRRDPVVPKVGGDGEILFLPFGVQVDYFLEVGAGAELRVDGWEVRGLGGRLEVLLRPEGGEETRLAEIDAGALPEPVPLVRRPDPPAAGPLTAPGPRLVRLRLRAVAPGVPGEDDGVVLVRPAVVSEPLPSPPAAAAFVGPAAAAGEGIPRRSLLIYLVDALRADHLGTYGHDGGGGEGGEGGDGGGISPEIDAFARRAVVFDDAQAPSSWTRTSVASLFTGLGPLDHGILRRGHKLSAEAVTLAEVLRDAGYATGAVVTNPTVGAEFGLDQGFEEYRELGEEDRSSQAVTGAALDWLDRRSGDAPFFLYLHALDPHDPYLPPKDLRPGVSDAEADAANRLGDDMIAGRRQVTPERIERIHRLYEGEVRANDRAFGALLAGLAERGLDESLIVLLVADHGEEFYEHRHFRHGRALYAESVRVPMILRVPGAGEGTRVAAPVQLLDVAPTLLGLVGVDPPPGLEGRDLGATTAPVPIYAYLHLDGQPQISVRAGRWKLIERVAGDHLVWPRLFDVEADPGEAADLAGERPVRLGRLETLLRDRLRQTDHRLAPEEAVIDEDLRQRLEALGYLQ